MASKLLGLSVKLKKFANNFTFKPNYLQFATLLRVLDR
ncbi:MAG: hypothetical protein ACJA13_001160 [Paraglaciecola sp.]|jgi:hypothetical protein